jgi:hypothetical protein
MSIDALLRMSSSRIVTCASIEAMCSGVSLRRGNDRVGQQNPNTHNGAPVFFVLIVRVYMIAQQCLRERTVDCNRLQSRR